MGNSSVKHGKDLSVKRDMDLVGDIKTKLDRWLELQDGKMTIAKELVDLMDEFCRKYAHIVATGRAENGHLRYCSWSNPRNTEGPDTCVCFLIGVGLREIVKKSMELKLK